MDLTRRTLGTQAQGSLLKLANVLQKYPDTNIEILGHTDDKGTNAYNQRLSQRRAASASSYLRSQGIANARVTTKGLGETDPKVPNDSEAGRADNRRVEFVITANQKMVEDSKNESN